MGMLTMLMAGVTATAYDLGGMSWLVVHIVEMEKFFVSGSGLIIGGVAYKFMSDFPAGSILFGPLGMCGASTVFFGIVQVSVQVSLCFEICVRDTYVLRRVLGTAVPSQEVPRSHAHHPPSTVVHLGILVRDVCPADHAGAQCANVHRRQLEWLPLQNRVR